MPAGMNKAELERQAVWPSQAAEQPDKLIKLPGQTKVGEDEYKEFLNLGHGGVFDLDLSRCAVVCLCATDISHCLWSNSASSCTLVHSSTCPPSFFFQGV